MVGMCRLAAYLGPPLPLARLLDEPEHGLVRQAWDPRELHYARLNADGYGVGWYAPDGRAAAYVYPGAIWTDPNLASLGRSLVQPLWLGFIRSATPGNPVHAANTQPFFVDQLQFVHNGYVGDFHGPLRARLLQRLAPEQLALVRGNSDSEHLFALWRQLLVEEPEASLEDTLVALSRQLDLWLYAAGEAPAEALLNIIVSDGRRLCALRHALRHACPSLYYCTDHEGYPDGQLIASEPLDHTALWNPVPPHHLLVLDPDEPPELRPLPI